MDARQAQYLENMGIPVWVERSGETGCQVDELRLVLGPGRGSRLLVCNAMEESSGRLAADLARSLPDSPVWAWPAVDNVGCLPNEAVTENLFSSVIVLGLPLAQQLFGEAVPELVGSARLIVVPPMVEMSRSGTARQACWQALVAGGAITAS